MDDKNSTVSAFHLNTTWSLVKQVLEASSDDRHHWTIEEFEKQGLMRATLEPRKELKREIVLNIYILEFARNVFQEQTTNYDVYKKLYWVKVRIDEDIYPYYKRKEKPEPIIAKTRDSIVDAISPKERLK